MIRKKALLTLFIIFIGLFPDFSARGQARLCIDELGRSVRVPYSPQKVISLAPSITEILFALGLNKEIAGVTDFCDHPEGASKKPRIGGFINPSIEKIISMQPDLIIGIRDGNRMETIHRLDDLGLPVCVVNPRGFDGVITTLQNIGEIVGRQGASKRIIAEMRKKRESIVSLTRSLSRPKVFFQLGYLPMITVGKGALADELIRLAGGRSISENESADYPSYNFEIVVRKGPEIIILSSMESKRDYSTLVKMWEKWESIPAVKRNAIHIIDSNIVDRPTPRIAEGLEAMARMIHPEVFEKRSAQGAVRRNQPIPPRTRQPLDTQKGL
jgi:iron complex transport system substrate-binding protein